MNKKEAALLKRLAKRELLLRRVLMRGQGGNAERQELREIDNKRREIYCEVDFRKVN